MLHTFANTVVPEVCLHGVYMASAAGLEVCLQRGGVYMASAALVSSRVSI